MGSWDSSRDPGTMVGLKDASGIPRCWWDFDGRIVKARAIRYLPVKL